MTLARPSSDPPPRKRGRPRKHPPALPFTRKRGAQPGNTNRWRHGRYSAAMREAKASLKAEIGEINVRIDVLVSMLCDTLASPTNPSSRTCAAAAALPHLNEARVVC